MQDLPEAYHMSGKIEALQGGLVLRKCAAEHARKIDLLMLSVGGNDVGFARLVANAVLADDTNLRRLGGWIGQVHGEREAERALDLLDDRYKSLNRAFHNILHLPWNENDRILLTAYPAMALLEDGRSVCPDGSAGMEVVPEFELSAREGARGPARRRQAASRDAHERARARLDVRRAPSRPVPRPRHLRGLDARTRCRASTTCACRASVGNDWEPYNPADYPALRLAPALVPHAQRRVHDRQLPRLDVADAERAEAAEPVVVPAAAGRDLFRRLPPDRRGPAAIADAVGGAGARGAGEVREAGKVVEGLHRRLGQAKRDPATQTPRCRS